MSNDNNNEELWGEGEREWESKYNECNNML